MAKMTEKENRASFISTFRFADGVDKLLMITGFLGAVGDGISMPASFFLMSKVYNHVGNSGTTSSQDFSHNINKISLILCYMAIGRGIACFLEGYCWTRTAERQASTLRARYLKAVLRQDVSYFDLHVSSTAEVIESVSSDSVVIQDLISEKMPVFLTNIWTFIGSYVVAFLMVWRLAIVASPFLVFLVIPGMVYGRALMSIARKIRDENSKAGCVVEQAISSIRTVYSFVGETKTAENYSSALQGAFELGLKQGLAKGLAIGSNGVSFAVWSFMIFYGSRLVMYHGAQGGSVFATGAAIGVGGVALGSGLSDLRYFSEAVSAVERVMKIIERVPEIDSESMEGEVPENVSGEVEFKNIEFAYPSRPESIILKGFNLRIPAGKTVALVGGSGSGKSTVVALLQRFYDPLGGEIFLDGFAINMLQIKFLRSQMGLVSQEPALFATSIKENILFGKEDASDEEVIEAAKSANAHDFISQLPQGYDTQVGERGIQVSGGQKQRIAIARAVIKAPKILLLDEATSALDFESERIVQEALDKAAMGRTTIIIAHRLSTIRNADLIAVVQNGQVMETGSHDELTSENNGLYTTLIRQQETKTTNQVVCETSVAEYSSESNVLNNGGNITKRDLSALKPTYKTDGRGMSKSVPSFKRLLDMSLSEWRHALVGCITAILVGAMNPTYAFAQASVISVYFLQDHDEIRENIRIYALSFVGLAVVNLFINVGQHYSFAVMGESLARRIRENMFSKILTFEIGWFDKPENSTGAICSRLAKDSNVARSLVGDRMSLLIQTISTVATAFTMGLVIAWKLAIVLIALQPITISCFYFRIVLFKKMSKKSQKSQEESSKIAVEAVSNQRTVAAFSSQPRILKILERAQQAPHLENIRQSWFSGLALATSNVLLTMCWAFSYWYCGKLITAGSISPKALFQTMNILVNTGTVIARAAAMTSDLSNGSQAIVSIFDVLDRDSSIEPEEPNGIQPSDLTGHVELLNVYFAYPSRSDVMIFKGFSLAIKAGKSTALVGQSGSGKSTIIGLIERFYDPVEGVVKIDNRDIRSYHLRALRKHIALVSQEPALFSGTVRQNIMYGASKTVDESEIIEAAKIANAHDFITALKDGYDTWCGDKGLQLSGGQKQRIAIARAILKNPTILLLDEATSALDSQSERVVQDALERIMVGRTSVVVAHRLSTVRGCDNIVVLDKGRVVEKGTHSDLLNKGSDGAYFSLVSLQSNTIV